MNFFGRNNSLFKKFHQTFAKTHSLISLIFFLVKLPSLKVYTKFLERMMQKHIQNPIKL